MADLTKWVTIVYIVPGGWPGYYIQCSDGTLWYVCKKY